MRLLYAVLLLLAACTAPQPTTYERGTFTRPPPAPHRPGVGLPQPQMPGQHVAPQVQPNPRPKRLLPPQSGPGIWAGDEPKASNGRLPDLLDVVFPLPDGIEPEQVPALKRCGDLYSPIFAHMQKTFEHAMNLDQQERACLAYALLGDCVYQEEAANPNTVPVAVLRHIDALFKKCYPHVGTYTTIIRDIETARKRNIPSTKGDH